MDLETAKLHLNFAEINAPAMNGLASKVIFREFTGQHENFRSAISWFFEHGYMDETFRFIGTLIPYWMRTGRIEEGLALLEKALSKPGGSNTLRGRASFDAGYLLFWKGEYERAGQMHSDALAFGRRTKNPTVIAMALTGFARISLKSDLVEARRYCLEALDVTNGTQDQLGRSNAIHVLGVVAQMMGDLTEAHRLMKQRIKLAQKLGNYAVVSSEMGNLSMVERQLGNLDEAEALSRQALEIDYQRGDELAIPWKVNGLISVAVDREAYKHAAILIGIADTAMKISGGQWPPDEFIHYEHSVAALEKEMGFELFENFRRQGRRMAFPQAMDYALYSTSDMLKIPA